MAVDGSALSPGGDDAGQQGGEGAAPAEPQQEERPPTIADVRQLRAEARSWRLRYQGAAKAEEELAQLRNAGRSELERATSAAAQAAARAEAAELRALRVEVAAAKGLPANIAGRLQGATREELEADAEELMRTLAPPAQQHQRPRTDPGHRSTGPATGQTPSDWLRDKLVGGR